MSESDKILDQCGKECMREWDLESFKLTHPLLYITIKKAMAGYAMLQVAEFAKEMREN